MDLATGKRVIVTSLEGPVSALGFNQKDNYLYGFQARTDGSHRIIRISSEGTTQVVSEDLGNISVNMGEIDNKGFFFLSNGGAAWYQVDLREGSITYGQIIDSGTAPTLGYNIGDWVWLSAGGGYLYTIATNSPGANTGTMLRFATDAKIWYVFHQYTNTPTSGWDALYAVNGGVFYGSDQSSGQIWAFGIDSRGPALKSSSMPFFGLSDGTRCPISLPS